MRRSNRNRVEILITSDPYRTTTGSVLPAVHLPAMDEFIGPFVIEVVSAPFLMVQRNLTDCIQNKDSSWSCMVG
jgi:hypothetical protein